MLLRTSLKMKMKNAYLLVAVGETLHVNITLWRCIYLFLLNTILNEHNINGFFPYTFLYTSQILSIL